MSTGAMVHPVSTAEAFPNDAADSRDRPDALEVSPEETLTSAEFRRKFTIADLERLYEVGFLDEETDRYELIDGDLIDMGRIQPPHSSAINRSTRLFTLGLQDRAFVITQNPMRLGVETLTQPQPDVTLAKFRKDGYQKRHPFPEDVFLAIEVMDTSHRYDHGVKLPKYARSGIRETWLMDLPGQKIEIHRRPVEGVYLDRTILLPGETIAAEAFPDLVLSVSDLLGLPEAESES